MDQPPYYKACALDSLNAHDAFYYRHVTFSVQTLIPHSRRIPFFLDPHIHLVGSSTYCGKAMDVVT